MKDLLVLRDLECVKAIAHPRRIDILNAFDKEPLSAKQLSEMLDEPHAKINYHIKTLYNVGILELVEEKIKSGIVEKYYYPTANNVVMSRKIIWKRNESASYPKQIPIRLLKNITIQQRIMLL